MKACLRQAPENIIAKPDIMLFGKRKRKLIKRWIGVEITSESPEEVEMLRKFYNTGTTPLILTKKRDGNVSLSVAPGSTITEEYDVRP